MLLNERFLLFEEIKGYVPISFENYNSYTEVLQEAEKGMRVVDGAVNSPSMDL